MGPGIRRLSVFFAKQNLHEEGNNSCEKKLFSFCSFNALVVFLVGKKQIAVNLGMNVSSVQNLMERITINGSF